MRYLNIGDRWHSASRHRRDLVARSSVRCATVTVYGPSAGIPAALYGRRRYTANGFPVSADRGIHHGGRTSGDRATLSAVVDAGASAGADADLSVDTAVLAKLTQREIPARSVKWMDADLIIWKSR